MTNYEKIKSMSVEEISWAIVNMINCSNNCPMHDDCIKLKSNMVLCTDQNNVRKWLEAEQ